MNLVAREARAEDYDFFARLFLELRVPDPTPTPAQFEARVRPYAFLLWNDARPMGYASWQALGEVARVIHVVVDPVVQGHGAGAALMRELAVRARRAGCSRWQLNVKPDNVPAVRLYTRFGLRVVGRPIALKMAWSDVVRLPLEEGTEAFLVVPEDEARVEAAAGLLCGQLREHRKGGGQVFLGLRRGDDVVAFATFDPSSAGARVFVPRRPGLARPLLEAMQRGALPEHSCVRLHAEDDDVLSALRAAGAEKIFEMLRMEGPVTSGPA